MAVASQVDFAQHGLAQPFAVLVREAAGESEIAEPVLLEAAVGQLVDGGARVVADPGAAGQQGPAVLTGIEQVQVVADLVIGVQDVGSTVEQCPGELPGQGRRAVEGLPNGPSARGTTSKRS